MSVAFQFKQAFESASARLDDDEWATANVRDDLLKSLQPWEAFEAVPEVLRLALEQQDESDFANYCWFLSGLMEKADTTECSREAAVLLPLLQSHAREVGGHSDAEAARVLKHFVLPANNSQQARRP